MKKTLKLRKPVELLGEMTDTLELREPTFGDMVEVDKAPEGLERVAKWIEVLSNWPMPSIHKLSPRDINEVVLPALEDFLQGGQPTPTP